MNTEKKYGSSTRCVHVGTGADPNYGSVVTPIYQTTTYSIPNVEDLIALYGHKKTGYTYTSTGNPTQRAAEIKIADLEGSEVSRNGGNNRCHQQRSRER